MLCVGAFRFCRDFEFSECSKVKKKNKKMKFPSSAVSAQSRTVAQLSAVDMLLGVRLRPQAATHAGEYQHRIGENLVQSPLGSHSYLYLVIHSRDTFFVIPRIPCKPNFAVLMHCSLVLFLSRDELYTCNTVMRTWIMHSRDSGKCIPKCRYMANKVELKQGGRCLRAQKWNPKHSLALPTSVPWIIEI